MMVAVAIVVEWPDGSVTRGVTPDDVLAKIGRAQWEPVDPQRAAQVLTDRAWAWSGAAIDDTLPVEALLRELADAGMFRIVEWT
jgi:hypothetical protein